MQAFKLASIPLTEKNRELSRAEIGAVLDRFGIAKGKPMLLQVARFDRFKDQLGTMRAYRIAKKHHPCQLVLAGSGVLHDPEGEAVLAEVQQAAGNDPDIHILQLPPEADREMNALQRGASIVIQKALKEGFGVSVSEAMWKGKPVIGGTAGGVSAQIVDQATGGWGHINVDQITQTDRRSPQVLADVKREFRIEKRYLNLPIKNGGRGPSRPCQNHRCRLGRAVRNARPSQCTTTVLCPRTSRPG